MSDRCTVQAGPDRCELRAGHPGEHHTMWGSVRMSWQGGEEWSHDWAAFAAGTGEDGSGRPETAPEPTGVTRTPDRALDDDSGGSVVLMIEGEQ